eukprot:1424966-Rhodomonas_salina.4
MRLRMVRADCEGGRTPFATGTPSPQFGGPPHWPVVPGSMTRDVSSESRALQTRRQVGQLTRHPPRAVPFFKDDLSEGRFRVDRAIKPHAGCTKHRVSSEQRGASAHGQLAPLLHFSDGLDTADERGGEDARNRREIFFLDNVLDRFTCAA